MAGDQVRSALGAEAVSWFEQRAPGALVHLGRLRSQHEEQWALEDRSRGRRASSADIARAKAGIDALNADRHRLIDAVDAAVVPEPIRSGRAHQLPDVPSHVQNSRSYGETPGELCDRLLIIGLKLERAASNGGSHAPGLRAWQAHLQCHLGELLGDLAAGRALLPPRAEVKVYADR